MESLQKSQRQLTGEDIQLLSTKELQHLELRIENGLKQIRLRKVRFASLLKML